MKYEKEIICLRMGRGEKRGAKCGREGKICKNVKKNLNSKQMWFGGGADHPFPFPKKKFWNASVGGRDRRGDHGERRLWNIRRRGKVVLRLAVGFQLTTWYYVLVLRSVPKFTANLYCTCLSIDLRFFHQKMQYRFAVNFGTLSIRYSIW